MNTKAKKHLFDNFSGISSAEWEKKIQADLKGVDYEKKLIWKTSEGLKVKPFYREEDLKGLGHLKNLSSLRTERDTPNGWTIVQDIVCGSDPEAANQRMQEALKGGAQALRIHLAEGQPPELDTLKVLLKGIHLKGTCLFFTGCMGADILYQGLNDLAAETGTDIANLSGCLGADPLGKMSETGIAIGSMENIGRLAGACAKKNPLLKSIEVNGAMLQNAGANLIEELAFSMAMASDYMALLMEKGLDARSAQDQMLMVLSSGSSYYMEIAKIRAARLLWGKIAEAYGVEESHRRITLQAISSQWNMTLYDPHVNILRGTTEAMSAILGGADQVSVLPYDHPYQNGNSFSDRIARNVQIILREEAYFDRVADPAAGSYLLESLTSALAEGAWELFQECETLGGYRSAFENGWVQEKIELSRQSRTEKAAQGRERILGTNAFPNFNEMILSETATISDDEYPAGNLKPLRPFRVSEAFEQLRLKTEKSGKRPRVFLFKYGNPAWVTARAAFSGNFFACAGYEIVDLPPFKSLEEGISHAKEAKYDLVVLCSSDEVYAEMGPKVLKALGEQSEIVIAGYPKDSMESLQKVGIKHFIHMKSKLLDTLTEFNNIIL